MVNDAIRTRQYREVLDAEKNISRQIYNLYQRQEAAYNEGIPSIRNQNQLAPIAGVIETVSAFQAELQNLMNSAANSYFQFSANNFVPVVKTFNSLVSALRSIQNIYKRDVQIKYEVDKLLQPVIDLIQSLASQLAYDPAISNRLFQMKANLQSKVYERVDYNVGKRTVIKVEEEEKPTVQTFQPGSQKKMDSFQQPIQYNPESNDPFVGQERIKPETPATFEGLDVAGFKLEDADRAALKIYMDAVREVEKPINWEEATGEAGSLLKKRRIIQPIINSYFDRKIQPLYDQLSSTAQSVVDKNNKTENYIKDTLTQNFVLFQDSIVIPKNTRRPRIQALPQETLKAVRPQRQAQIEEPQGDAVFQSPPQPALSLSQQFTPIFGSPSSPQKTIDRMTDNEIKTMLISKAGPGVYNQLRSDTLVKGNSWDRIIENIKQNYASNPETTVRHLNQNYQLTLPIPAKTPKKKGVISKIGDSVKNLFSSAGSPAQNPFIEELD